MEAEARAAKAAAEQQRDVTVADARALEERLRAQVSKRGKAGSGGEEEVEGDGQLTVQLKVGLVHLADVLSQLNLPLSQHKVPSSPSPPSNSSEINPPSLHR